jgi:uncharacterized protein YodC (DUF2158 family)
MMKAFGCDHHSQRGLVMSFEVGDIVVLRSGGPKMTVEHVDGDSIFCRWFDKTKQEKSAFIAATLIKQKQMSPEELAKIVAMSL